MFLFPGGATSPSPYTTDAVYFDGTNDYLTKSANLTGGADVSTQSVVFWLDLTANSAADMYFIWGDTGGGYGSINIGIRADDYLRARVYNSSNTEIFAAISATQYTDSMGWTCFMWSRSGTAWSWREGDTDLKAGATSVTADAGDFPGGSCTLWGVGRSDGTSQKINGNTAALWYDDTYLDFATESNRRKFIDSDGKPVDLGSDGSTPTGASPLIFLNRDTGDAASTYGTNKGTGGNFTITGSLTDSTSGSPTD